ncbi:hypothetical protein DYB28_010634 [Aphanomyces astaci]|uniref:Uncharacterized protein n=1 Tax=Aphanomyces astaci TaxID=112090 RepID=A0A9X8E8D9_APHAT|nr:hypothetical protein DYB28_010634 [Aphanomyces astaci]
MLRNSVVEAYSTGAATGVVTQVERILPNLLEVDRMGVTMVDPSGAAVTLRDLLVMEEPDLEDPFAPKFDNVDRTIPLEHFLAKFNIIQKKYGLNDTPVLRIFDDRLTSCGKEFIQKTLSRKMAEITDNSHWKSTEAVREYTWRIAGASREAGLQANRAVVVMINGCSDAEVSACLRGGSVRPETFEISLDYLIERDVDIDRRTDGSRSAPQMPPVAPSTPTRSARNTSRKQSPSTPNGNLQELQASISRLQRDMTSLTTSVRQETTRVEDTSPGVVRDAATIKPRTAPGLGDDTKNDRASQPPQTKGVPGSAYKDMEQEGGIQERPEDKLQTKATMLPTGRVRNRASYLSRKTAP